MLPRLYLDSSGQSGDKQGRYVAKMSQLQGTERVTVSLGGRSVAG
jgi:hypothetical protein